MIACDEILTGTLIGKTNVVRGREAVITDQRQFVRLNLCIGRNHQKKSLGFLRMLSIEFPHDPAVPLLGIDPKEMKTGAKTKTFT